jgi:hypothetical protein
MRKDKKRMVKVLDCNDGVIEVDEVGIPTLFQPNDWDIAEELENNEALREYQRDMENNS